METQSSASPHAQNVDRGIQFRTNEDGEKELRIHEDGMLSYLST